MECYIMQSCQINLWTHVLYSVMYEYHDHCSKKTNIICIYVLVPLYIYFIIAHTNSIIGYVHTEYYRQNAYY